MSLRFKIGMLGLGVLAAACLALLLLQDPTPQGGPAVELTADGDGLSSRPSPEGLDAPPPIAPGMEGRAPKEGPARPGGSDSLVGAREPEGIDLSDPDVRRGELRRILTTQPIEWLKAGKVVALMQPGERVPEDLRGVILQELRGGRRLQVMHVFNGLSDDSFVTDLFDLLGHPETSAAHERAALEALWRMPGGDDNEIARRLEGRLTNDLRKDVNVLRAIGKRGGPEAARAMVEYLQRAKNPLDVRTHILQSLDVTNDPEAARVVNEALRGNLPAKVQRALIEMVSRPGATAMTESLIQLGRRGADEGVRSRTLVALGRIGDLAATEHLLETAAENSAFGEQALQSLATMQTSDPKVGDLLATALADAGGNPRPERAKASLLQALGTARHERSLPVIANALDDQHPGVKEAAISAMGRMGSNARGYVQRLAGLYDGANPRMQQKVAVALGDIGGKEAIKRMRGMLEEKGLNPSVKRTLQMALKHAEGELVRSPR